MLTVKAPAKINWSLHVLTRRDDGYHAIRSLMHCVGLCDTLTFSDTGSTGTIELVSAMELPPEQNIVYRAAELLRSHAGTDRGARITLVKEIPSGAGLGGGSSDAAAALKGLNELWGLGMERAELKALGSRLGSDVPFFFDAPLAIAEGRGELLTPLSLSRSYTLLLVKPALSVETAWAYRELSASALGRGGAMSPAEELTKERQTINNIQLIYEALKSGDRARLASLVHNDFEGIVFKRYSVIRAIKEGLLACGALPALMSGSGSTVFGLFEDRETALSASRRFPQHFCRVAETLTTAL
ncbi:MAG: 4-(cytidine 5'-diphospho)-2-C-methyl-D-erythritol kinase [Nitrospirota bacterium]